jgi:hypothetical protein
MNQVQNRRNRQKNKMCSVIGGARPGETPDLEDAAVLRKVQALDSMFAESMDSPELFHQMYVKPLLDEGVSLEAVFDLLVASALGAN